MKEKAFNLAGKIAEFFIVSKLTLLFIFACILMGIVAVALTPREENPQIIVPGAEVWVTLPGVTTEEIEELILNPLEGAISELTGVDHIYGTAMNSVCLIVVEFEVGEDKEKSLTKLYDKIRSIYGQLPPGSSMPLVKSIDVDDVPIITVTLASEVYDDYALKRLADRMVEKLRSLNDVSLSYVQGGRDREIRVELDPDRLMAFGVTLDQIQVFLSAANLAGPLGNTVKEGKNRSLFLDSFLDSADAVARLIVGIHKGRPIYIEDVADVIDAPAEERKIVSRFAFGPADPRFGKNHDPEMPAVTIAVAKKKGTNAVVVAKKIIARVERMRNNFLPSEVHMVITRNDGYNANTSVNRLIEHLGIAIIVVFLIMALFLGIKEAVIIGLSIPLILALTLGCDLLFGLTINRMTLFGLIVAMGMLVDASIVVTENINRHLHNINQSDKRLATVLATNEIGNPTNLATFAVMMVFSSLIFLTGMSKPYILPITFNVPVSMLASLLVAYIITPWAAYLWLPSHETNDSSVKQKNRLYNFYYKIITPVIDKPKNRWFFLGVIVLCSFGSFLLPAWQFIRPQGVGGPASIGSVGVDIMPKDDKNTFNITIDMPESTPIEVTDQMARQIGEMLRRHPSVTNYQIFLGTAGVIDFSGLLRGSGNKIGPHVAEIRVNLIVKNKRKTSSSEIVRDLRPIAEKIRQQYPGTTLRFMEDPPGPPTHSPLRVAIYGHDQKTLRRLSSMVVEEFRETYDIIEVYDTQEEDIREYRIVVDKEKTALSGITTAQVAKALQRIVDGEIMGRVHIPYEKNPVPIRIHVPRRYQIDPNVLARIYITNQNGQKIPLSEITSIVFSWKDRLILHKDNERVTYVGAALLRSSPFCAVFDLDKRLKKINTGDGVKLPTANLSIQEVHPDTIDGPQLLWEGEMRLTLDVFRDLSISLLFSLTLIFLLLVGYYRSFIIPLIAMSAIPLAFIGVFPGHWIMGDFYSMASNIGVVALAGIVVRNSLLIIDFTINYLKDGYPLRDAVREAGAIRLRPILLTALAIVFGTSIMLTDLVFKGLAISIIFGTIASTLFTIIVVPVLLYLFFLKYGEKYILKESEND